MRFRAAFCLPVVPNGVFAVVFTLAWVSPFRRFCDVLSNYLRTNNFASFVRQLNYYGFHKMTHNRERGKPMYEFRHERFVRDSPHLIADIKRRATAEPAVVDSDSLRSENEKLRARITVLQNDLAESRQLVEATRKKLAAAEEEIARMKAVSAAVMAPGSSPSFDTQHHKRQRAGSPLALTRPAVDYTSPFNLQFDTDFDIKFDAPITSSTPFSLPPLGRMNVRGVSDLSLPSPSALDIDAELLADFGVELIDSPLPELPLALPTPSTVSTATASSVSASSSTAGDDLPRDGDVELIHGLLRRLEEDELSSVLSYLTMSTIHADRHNTDITQQCEDDHCASPTDGQDCTTLTVANKNDCPLFSRATPEELQALLRFRGLNTFMKLFSALMAFSGFAAAVDQYKIAGIPHVDASPLHLRPAVTA